MDRIDLKIGEERAVHLPPTGEWTVQVEGMASAVQIRKLWAADPYPEDDEEDAQPKEPQDTVFMVRGIAPGTATLRFVSAPPTQVRDVQVNIRM